MLEPMTSPIKLIIFDCDGVLVDTEVIANRVFFEHLTTLNWPLNIDETAAEFTGKSLTLCAQRAEEILERKLPPHFIDKMQEETMEALAKELKPMPEIHSFCEHLNAIDMPFVVASSGAHQKIKQNLLCAKLIDFFEQRFSAEDVAHGKPAPDVFLLAANTMGIEPQNCLVIEDSHAGMQAAVAAGMQLICYNSNQLTDIDDRIPTFNNYQDIKTFLFAKS